MDSRIRELDAKLRRYLLVSISLHARYCHLPSPAGILIHFKESAGIHSAAVVLDRFRKLLPLEDADVSLGSPGGSSMTLNPESGA
jgi:hypothetical protein